MFFRGMKIYTVHVKDDAVKSGEKPVFIREGFNPAAFLLTFIWAFAHRLWFAGFAILAAFYLLIQIGIMGFVSSLAVGILQLAMQVIIGYLANDWHRRGLARRGYIMTDVTTGDSLLRAERRYFERYLQTISA